MLDDVSPPCIADRLEVPQRPAQQVLKRIGCGIAADFGQWPAVLAIRWAQHPRREARARWLIEQKG